MTSQEIILDKPIKPCDCGSDDWWWREPSNLGGRGAWVCGKCHPKPNKEGKDEDAE